MQHDRFHPIKLTPKSPTFISPVSPIYDDFSESLFSAQSNRLVELNQQIYNNMETSKKILSSPPNRHMKSFSMMTPKDLNDYSIDKKLKLAENKINTEPSVDEYLLKETLETEKTVETTPTSSRRLKPKVITSVKINRPVKVGVRSLQSVTRSPSITRETGSDPPVNRLYKQNK